MVDNAIAPRHGFIIAPKLYDKIKFLVQVLIPAFGTLYFTLGNTWEWPNIEQVLGTTTALGLFLGTIVGISSATYKASDARFDGDVVVNTSKAGKKLFTLELDGDPADIENMTAVTFRVRNDQLPEG